MISDKKKRKEEKCQRSWVITLSSSPRVDGARVRPAIGIVGAGRIIGLGVAQDGRVAGAIAGRVGPRVRVVRGRRVVGHGGVEPVDWLGPVLGRLQAARIVVGGRVAWVPGNK